MKNTIIVFLLLVLPLKICFGQKSIEDYLIENSPNSIYLMMKYHIPASVILGVSINESGIGKSILARKFNNYFGIRGKNKNARKKLGRKSTYREFKNKEESFEVFCRLLKRKPYYNRLKRNKNPFKWLKAMAKNGYSTEKEIWLFRMTQTIKKYNLTRFDK